MTDGVFSTRLRRLDSMPITTMLLVHAGSWRNRTVTKLAILDQRSVRWRTSVDFTIPPHPDKVDCFSLYIPVALVAKRKLADVDLTDETGRRLPALNREHEAQLALEAIVELWFANTGANLTTEQLTTTDVLANGHEIEVTASVVGVLAELIVEQPSAAALRLAWLKKSGLLDRIDDPADRAEFERTLQLFVRNGVIYTRLDDTRPLQRRIVKLSFRDRIPPRRLGAYERTLATQPALARRMRAGVRDLTERLLQSVGIRSTPLLWRVPGGPVASYHVEAAAPKGLVFIDSLLAEESGAPALDDSWSARFHAQRLDQGRPGAEYVHLYHDASGSKARGLLHALYLRTPPSGWLITTVLTAFVLAVVLTVISASVGKLYRIDRAPSAASALLALGAIAVVFLARPLEHSLTARLLRGARYALIAAALASLVAIGMLLRIPTPVGHKAKDLEKAIGSFYWARWYLVAIAWTAFAILAAGLVSWVISTLRLSRRRSRFEEEFSERVGLSS